METQIGRFFGPYRLQKLLGRGGMGTVFRAYEAELDRMVAVKVLDPALARDTQFVERFNREARFLASLSHNNLIHVYSIGRTDDGYHYMAMEYLEGITLDARIRTGGALSIGEAWRVTGQVLSALYAIHKAGLVHRDVKPSNIMLCADDRAVLMDFGLAKAPDQPGITREGIIAGTPEYMSPEQARGEQLDGRSDLYSLGVTLFEALTTKVPFSGKSALTVLRSHCEDPVPDLLEMNPALTPAIAAVVNMALAKERDLRYFDAPEMASAMLKIEATSELVELSKRSRISELPQTRLVSTEPKITAQQRRDSYEPTVLAEELGPQKRRIPWLKYVAIFAAAFFALIILGSAVKGCKVKAGKIKPTPRYIKDAPGNPVVANPLCRIYVEGDPNPILGRLEEINELGVVTYIPIGTTEPKTISKHVRVELLSEEELKKIKETLK
ncbi:MAG: hypothetical protein Kow00107_00520 [Planctomycetota bacterium]